MTYTQFIEKVTRSLLGTIIHRNTEEQITRILEEAFGGRFSLCSEVPEHYELLHSNFIVIRSYSDIEIVIGHSATISTLSKIGTVSGQPLTPG